MKEKGENQLAILSFGEILWDVYGNDKKIGGAPLNVSAHLGKLGNKVYMISSIGDDELGILTKNELTRLGLDTRYIHTTNGYGTGRADVTLSGGIPTYSFPTPSAWDVIKLGKAELDEIKRTRYDAFYYGTLSSRGNVSRSTLYNLFEIVDANLFFFDVNLRLNYYDKEIITKGLERADILKLNDEEYEVLVDLLGIKEGMEEILSRFDISAILLTKGKEGASYITKDKVISKKAGKVKPVDTVGAGDSVSAAVIHFLTHGMDEEFALEKALALADFVVTEKGAVPDYPEWLSKALGI